MFFCFSVNAEEVTYTEASDFSTFKTVIENVIVNVKFVKLPGSISSATTKNLYVKRTNLTDGVKYYFKVVPYVTDINGNKRVNYYKVSSIYTLKKVNVPTVTKYSSKYVKVR